MVGLGSFAGHQIRTASRDLTGNCKGCIVEAQVEEETQLRFWLKLHRRWVPMAETAVGFAGEVAGGTVVGASVPVLAIGEESRYLFVVNKRSKGKKDKKGLLGWDSKSKAKLDLAQGGVCEIMRCGQFLYGPNLNVFLLSC